MERNIEEGSAWSNDPQVDPPEVERPFILDEVRPRWRNLYFERSRMAEA